MFRKVIGARRKAGHVGIEIEVEGRNGLPEVFDDTWTTKGDDSLRYVGREYVTSEPILVDGSLEKKLAAVLDQLQHPQWGTIHDSPRTSVHVHVNVQDLRLPQGMCMMLAYWIIENLMMRYCGDEREGNHFCLRLKDAEGALSALMRKLKESKSFDCFIDDSIRYCSQNYKAIAEFGSVEYRGMRGVYDLGILSTWVRALWSMRQEAIKFETPDKLMDFVLEHGVRAFLERLFPEMPQFIEEITHGLDLNKETNENILTLCEFAYMHDWQAWEGRMLSAGKPGSTRRRSQAPMWAIPPNAADLRVVLRGNNPVLNELPE